VKRLGAPAYWVCGVHWTPTGALSRAVRLLMKTWGFPRRRPALFTVGQPEGKPVPGRLGQWDGALIQMEVPVVDIRQLQLAQLPGSQSVKGDDHGECCPCRVCGVDRVAQLGRGQRHRMANFMGAGSYRADRVEKHDAVALEDTEQAAKSLPHGSAGITGRRKNVSDVFRCDLPKGGLSGIGPGMQSGQ
jgi:hypothetical protein